MSIVYDANGSIVGRLCAKVAKSLIHGESVAIVNAESALFSGSLDFVVEKYHNRRQMTDKSNPDHGAKWPRRPDMFLRRVIRGMLPKRNTRQKDALSRLRVYLGSPSEVTKAIPFIPSKIPNTTVTVGLVCKRLGWKGAFD